MFYIARDFFMHVSYYTRPERAETGYFILMGFVWGLALLSKMTAILLAPVLIIVIAFHTRLVQRSLKSALMPIIIVFCVSMLTAGWYYLRNYMKFGNPFARNRSDPLRDMECQWNAVVARSKL